MIKKNFRQIIIVIMVSLLLIIILSSTLLLIFSVNMADDTNKLFYMYSLDKNLRESNQNYSFNRVYNPYYNVSEVYSLDLESFEDMITYNYIYIPNIKDCKYWSAIWTRYIITNKNRYNWDWKYLTTDNHIFVMAYNKTEYCIFDGDEFGCYN